jgi:K+-dependent Na+/Ca+ exchanger-like protein
MPLHVAFIILFVSFYLMSRIISTYFLKSLDNIAQALKIPDSVSGATLLSMGTSAPEISMALVALFVAGTNPGVGVGTIIGSAIFQILVVVGFAAAVKTSYLNWKPVIRDSIFYAFAILLLILFISDGTLTVIEAAIFVGFYFVYLLILFLWARYMEEMPDLKKNEENILEQVVEGGEKDDKRKRSLSRKVWRVLTSSLNALVDIIPDPERKKEWTVPVFFICLGIIGYSCYWLVLAAEAIAVAFNVHPTIIALTILAGGSSIPELVSSTIVSKQGRGDMAISNAIGSNIFDILMSLGLPVLFYTMVFGDLTDIGGANVTSSIILLFVTLLMVISMLAAQKFKVTRLFGIGLIALYGVYVFVAYAGYIG